MVLGTAAEQSLGVFQVEEGARLSSPPLVRFFTGDAPLIVLGDSHPGLGWCTQKQL